MPVNIEDYHYCSHPDCQAPVPIEEVMGMEIQDVYDGILFWYHMPKNHYVHRWQRHSQQYANANRYATQLGITIYDG